MYFLVQDKAAAACEMTKRKCVNIISINNAHAHALPYFNHIAGRSVIMVLTPMMLINITTNQPAILIHNGCL